jgi:hypothetical protein
MIKFVTVMAGNLRQITIKRARVESYLIDPARIEKETGVRNSCFTEVPLGQSPREPSYTLEHQTRGQRI